MSENSGIEWTDHTWNPWWGCTKVHSGCANCYAEALDRRWGGDHWGKGATRRMVLGEWGKPAKWNREAIATLGRRARVFCASMCDLFEDFRGEVVDQRGDPVPMPGQWLPIYGKLGRRMSADGGRCWTVAALRARVFDLIAETPNLEWLLLTKRPENIVRMVPINWLGTGEWPANVMTGTSPCDQATADKCIPALLDVPGRHFLSIEPLLGPVELPLDRIERDDKGEAFWLHGAKCPSYCDFACGGGVEIAGGIDWVIVGGESGAKARPCGLGWIESILSQCERAGVPVFVKQLGAKPVGPRCRDCADARVDGVCDNGGGACAPKDPKGGDIAEWPKHLRVREFPALAGGGAGAAVPAL